MALTSVISRFNKGVHDREGCGKNINGYSAISAVHKSTDIHNLDSYKLYSSPSSSSHSRKKSFLSSETLIYMFTKLVLMDDNVRMYIILFSKETPICITLRNIMAAVLKSGSIIITILDKGMEFDMCIYAHDVVAKHAYYTSGSLFKLMTSFHFMRITVIGFPIFNRVFMELTNTIDPDIWCGVADDKLVYVSENGSDNYSHLVFPWSQKPLRIGFTVGTGGLRVCTESELNHYRGTFNFYENMISSVPINGACTDCNDLRNMAYNICKLCGDNSNPIPNRLLKRNSLQALGALNELIDQHASQL